MLDRSASLAMSTSVLKALPGKLDIKRHSPSILFIWSRDLLSRIDCVHYNVIQVLMSMIDCVAWWILLLRYSVLFTVESLSLLYLLVISWFICSRGCCIDKLGVFHAKQTSNCLIHIWTKGEVGAPWNWFKPSSKIFHWPFQSGTSFVDFLCFFSLLC